METLNFQQVQSVLFAATLLWALISTIGNFLLIGEIEQVEDELILEMEAHDQTREHLFLDLLEARGAADVEEEARQQRLLRKVNLILLQSTEQGASDEGVDAANAAMPNNELTANEFQEATAA